MASACDPFLKQELSDIEALITKYNQALLALEGPAPVTSYRLDTGQTSQSVTRADVSQMRLFLNYLNSKRDDLIARCGYTGDGTYVGTASPYARPL